MLCMSVDKLRSVVLDSGLITESGVGVLYPALGRNPARAQFLVFRVHEKDATLWSHPHEIVSLDPFDGRVLGRAPTSATELGVAPALRESAISFLEGGDPPDTFGASLDFFELAQPVVWSWFLERSTLTPEEAFHVTAFARAWADLIRPHQKVYYQSMSGEFERWLEKFR